MRPAQSAFLAFGDWELVGKLQGDSGCPVPKLSFGLRFRVLIPRSMVVVQQQQTLNPKP